MEPSTESVIAFLTILFSYLKNTGDEGKWHDDLFRLGFHKAVEASQGTACPFTLEKLAISGVSASRASSRKDCQQSITKSTRKTDEEIPEFARLESSCHSILR